MTYTCTTCGATSDSAGHLCSPSDTSLPLARHSASKGDARHLCREKTAPMRYTCANCGRVSTDQDRLCNPVTLVD